MLLLRLIFSLRLNANDNLGERLGVFLLSVNEFPSILRPNDAASLFEKYVLPICENAPYFKKFKSALTIPVKMLSPTVKFCLVLFKYVASSKFAPTLIVYSFLSKLYSRRVLFSISSDL